MSYNTNPEEQKPATQTKGKKVKPESNVEIPTNLDKFKVTPASIQHTLNTVERHLYFMEHATKGRTVGSALLGGDPGIGKTTFIKQISKLLGIDLITIEVPHITEEHIINIPFVEFDPIYDSSTGKVCGYDPHKNKLTLAESNLLSEIKACKVHSDSEYLASIYNPKNEMYRVMFEYFGGNKNNIPKDIQDIRKKFTCILFLDEYFRVTTGNIRNALRTILDGYIGADKLPASTYVVYASNMVDTDGSLEPVPSNSQIAMNKKHNYPTVDAWFAWFVSTFKDKRLNPIVIHTFYDILKDKNTGTGENFMNLGTSNDVRISPRRMEQLLLYVNAAIPCKSKEDAKALLSNVKVNFGNYLEKTYHHSTDEFLEGVFSIIQKTTPDFAPVNTSDIFGDDDWRHTLYHQIAIKKELGDARKYFPVLSGGPGIGKTSEILQLAEDLDMRLIYINGSIWKSEDISGIPTSKMSDEKKLQVMFQSPKMHKYIMDKIEYADNAYFQSVRTKYKANPQMAEHIISNYQRGIDDDGKMIWKYLLFFDELNRNEANVFNALRRVLLEKSFSDAVKLPKETIMAGAINPHDTGGYVTELTHHARDVMDIINSAPSWNKTKAYFESVKKEDDMDETASNIIMDCINAIIERFKTNESAIPIAQRPFHLMVGMQDINVNPRMWTSIYSNAVNFLSRFLDRHVNTIDVSELSPSELQRLEKRIYDNVFESFQDGMMTATQISEIHDADEFWTDLRNTIDDVDISDRLLHKRVEGIKNIKDIFEAYMRDKSSKLYESNEVVSYLEHADINQITNDITEWVHEKMKDQTFVSENIFKRDEPMLSLDENKDIITTDNKVSIFENSLRGIIICAIHNRFTNDKIEAIVRAISNKVFQDVWKMCEQKQQAASDEMKKLMDTHDQSKETRDKMAHFEKESQRWHHISDQSLGNLRINLKKLAKMA